jgi:hypothetical protein
MALRLLGSGSGYIELKAPASAGDNTLTLPTNNGSANTFLKTDGSGNLSWQSNLTFDGTKLDITTTGAGFRITRNSQYIELDGNFGNGGDQALATSAGFRIQAGGVGNNYERLRITSGGNIHINGVPPWSVTGGDWRNLSISGEGSGASGFLWLGNGAAATNADFDLARINICNGATIVAQIAGSTQTSANDDGRLSFHTKKTTGSLTEQLRILSNGDIGVGIAVPTTQSGKVFHLHAQNQQRLHMTNATTGSSATDGFEIIIEEGTDVRIRNFEAGALMFDSGGANNEAMRITSGGNVLIGDTSWQFAKALNVKGTSGSIISLYNSGTTSYAQDTSSAIELKLLTGNTGNQTGAVEIRGFKENGDNGNNARGIGFWTGANGSTNSEKLRIASNGNIYTNANTALPTGSTAGFGLGTDQVYISYTGTNANYCVRFYNGNGLVGSVLVNGSATAYNTSSDYRLKENEVAISDGITRLKTLKPYRFNFKTDSSKIIDGFFAHEVTPVVPEAISGEKDGTEMQGIDQSKLVPLITAALKEAIAKIETLETKVAALESA